MLRDSPYRNALAHSTSPYLKQHAGNPVFWYPWGEEALARARTEDKPILLSVGYSTCYWCHVMEREVFMNPSIAAYMNEHFINIKIDREEHPHLDETYMVARQLLTKEGGWPNNVFLTPDLKPFFAGGTFPPSDQQGRSGFPRLLEWLHHAWVTQRGDLQNTADEIAQVMAHYLNYNSNQPGPANVPQLADRLFVTLKKHYDESAGGFFQAPKFPHENYLAFLLAYYESTDDKQALNMVTHSLRRMAAGGIYDHVGCGFHRYAVDKEWYVPHFEKMLYNQAQLARLYADAVRLSGNPWLADIAKSIFDFVLGPMTDGSGGFYAAIDAETDAVEGAYYAWTPQEIESLLKPEEENFLITFYALADIPKFPGHKHAEGQVLILRQPLDDAAQEKNMPYLQLSAMCGHVMNKLLAARNLRKAPLLDNKIIVAWNGLMIDALAHAAKIFDKPNYAIAARRAADFLLEHAIGNDGKLCRTVTDGRAQHAATLEDYATLIKGLVSLHGVMPDQPLLDAAISLAKRVEELFADADGGYYFTEASPDILVRIKNADDSALPNANALMLDNLLALHAITKNDHYKIRALALREFFLSDSNRALVEVAALMQASLKLEMPSVAHTPRDSAAEALHDDTVAVSASLLPQLPKPGELCEVIVTLDIMDGWHIHAHDVAHPMMVATQVDVQGQGAELVEMVYPEPLHRQTPCYEGLVHVTARLRISEHNNVRPPFKVRVRYQPCTADSCRPVQDVVITI